MLIRGTRGPLFNLVSLGSGEIVARAAGFVATAIVARRLGADAFGLLGFAAAAVGYFGVALTAGFSDIAASEVARRPSAARRLAADATVVRLSIAICGIGVLTVAALVLVGSPVTRTVLLLTSMSLVPLALDTTWAYRGLGRNHMSAIGLVTAQVVYLGGILLLVRDPTHLYRVPVVLFVGEMLAAGLLFALLFGTTISRPSLSSGLEILRRSGFSTIARLLRAVIVTFDVILLGILATSRDVGLYTAAYRICFLAATIAVATHAVFLPAITHAAEGGEVPISGVLRRSVSLTGTVMIPIVAGGVALAGPLLLLFFGPDYADGTRAFQLLLLSIGLLSLHGTTHNVFLALHRTKQEAGIFAGGAVLNIILNLVLIPRYGLAGAAISTVSAEMLIVLASAWALFALGVRPQLEGLIRPLFASTAMVALLLLLSGRASVPLLVTAGAALYAGILAVTGGLPEGFREPRSGTRDRIS